MLAPPSGRPSGRECRTVLRTLPNLGQGVAHNSVQKYRFPPKKAGVGGFVFTFFTVNVAKVTSKGDFFTIFPRKNFEVPENRPNFALAKRKKRQHFPQFPFGGVAQLVRAHDS